MRKVIRKIEEAKAILEGRREKCAERGTYVFIGKLGYKRGNGPLRQADRSEFGSGRP